MFYILSSLRQERHGYGIMLHVKEITQGRIIAWGRHYLSNPAKVGKRPVDPSHLGNRPKKAVSHHRAREELLREEARRIIALSKLAEELL